MNQKPFDPTKPVQTRSGKPARIVCTDAKSPYPIVALVAVSQNHEEAQTFTLNGWYVQSEQLPTDLVNIPEKRFVNIWEYVGRYKVSPEPYATAEEAKNVTEELTNINYYIAIAVEVDA